MRDCGSIPHGDSTVSMFSSIFQQQVSQKIQPYFSFKLFSCNCSSTCFKKLLLTVLKFPLSNFTTRKISNHRRNNETSLKIHHSLASIMITYLVNSNLNVSVKIIIPSVVQ